MQAITISSGNQKITLFKSTKLIGVKTQDNRVIDMISHSPYSSGIVHNNLGNFKIFQLHKLVASVDVFLDKIKTMKAVIGTHVYHLQGNNNAIVPNGDINITFEDGISFESQIEILNEFQLRMIKRRADNRLTSCTTLKTANPLEVAKKLERLTSVKLAEPDLDAELVEYDDFTPADNLFEFQWYFKNEGNIPATNLPKKIKNDADAKIKAAWKRVQNRIGAKSSSEVVVAIVDNGFDVKHPDLRPNLFRPFDFWTGSERMEEGISTHGTSCSGLAIASENGSGVVGVAPNSKYMPVGGVAFSLRRTEEIFDYCIKNGADIISCSWGTTDEQYALNEDKIAAIVKAAKNGRNGKGCVVLFAAGNENYDYLNYYATIPEVIAVGACNSEGTHSVYSNRGYEITLCAPSSGVWPLHWPTTTTRAHWDKGIHSENGNRKYWRDGISRGSRYKHFGGTSAATPIVAGICALMLSVNPDLTASEVKQILTDTADKIGFPHEYRSGHSVKFGHGRVNADKAVAEAIRRKDGIPPPNDQVGNNIKSGGGLYRFDVSNQKSQGYAVQMGVFAEYGNVLIQAEKLQKKFREEIIVNINELSGKTVYKVLVGVFDTRSEANNLKQKMANANIGGFVVNLNTLG